MGEEALAEVCYWLDDFEPSLKVIWLLLLLLLLLLILLFNLKEFGS